MQRKCRLPRFHPGLKWLKTYTHRLFDTGRFSNLVVRLGTKTWKVHRNILCTASGLFNKACEGEWKVVLSCDSPLHTACSS